MQALKKVMVDEGVELTLQPTRPDLDVVEFQASISKWPHEIHAIGRSSDPERAVLFALRLWGNGQHGVWDEDDETDGGAHATVGRRSVRLRRNRHV